MAPLTKVSSSDAQVPSSSSHRLASAPSSSVHSRKSSSAHPTTSSGSPPRTQLSSPTPIPIPWQNYRQQLVRRFSRGDTSPTPAIDPSRASDPGKNTSFDQEAKESLRRRRSNRRPTGDRVPNIRRASYATANFSPPEEAVQDGVTEGRLWIPSNAPGATAMTAHLNVSTNQNLHNISGPTSQSGSVSAMTSSSGNSTRRQSRSSGPSNHRIFGHRLSNASPNSDRSSQVTEEAKGAESVKAPLGIIGVCALDSKARSKPCRSILNRINAKSEFEVIIFGDKVILDEEPKNWPICDYLVAFFSEGFPLGKAIEYTRIRKPFSVNDLRMQMVLWDRRLCLYILDRFEVRTPQRIEVTRDGGPQVDSPDTARHIYERTGLRLPGPLDGTGGGAASIQSVAMLDDDTLSVDGKVLKKPFVEKPTSGEDHNIRIYYAGGGGRRLFRKINNKSSDPDDSLNVPRCITDQQSSYIYESFLGTQNNEDVKAYTVGPAFCHAETRKSPVVDGIVKRNTHGKEMRYVTSLSREEAIMASRISEAFGQRICGFDLLRAGGKSFVIDVNGWSFVKDNNEYYDKCARILTDLFVEEKHRREGRLVGMDGEAASTPESPTRPSASHFQRMKSILKSPSMSRMAGHHAHGRHHKNSVHSSPDRGARAGSMSAGPTLERPERLSAAPLSKTLPDPLPTPAIPVSPSGTLTPEVISHVEAEKPVPLPEAKSQWKLKGMVAVIRHADRTPKQKLKFTFHTRPFIELLKGHREEVLLTGEAALESVMHAARIALAEGIEETDKLKLLLNTLHKKAALAGTKIQIKPMFKKPKEKEKSGGKYKNEKKDHKELNSPTLTGDTKLYDSPIVKSRQGTPDFSDLDEVQRQSSISNITMSREAAAESGLDFEKLQLIVKWGGEPTHSARYQSQELGENMRNDLLLMNRDVLDDVSVYSSSERRVTTSAQMWSAAFLDKNEVPPESIKVRKDLLDDSNAAKDEMDKVKKKLKDLLRKGNKAPPQFAWPENMPEPYVVAHNVVELMKFHRIVMRENFKTLYSSGGSSIANTVINGSKSPRLVCPTNNNSASSMTKTQLVNNIQNRWCSGEDADLFRERWEKLFDEFYDPDKVDPSKISELHDTMKYDSIHNRQFLEWVFTPSPELLESFVFSEAVAPGGEGSVDPKPPPRADTAKSSKTTAAEKMNDGASTADKSSFPHFIGFRKRNSVDPHLMHKSIADAASESYFNLVVGAPRSKSRTDVRLEKLRELFLYSKVLFDFIGPQEYGILNSEKLEIGLLTSLPLLRAIVNDLEDMQKSQGSKTTCYFTKESHIYTLVNCIIEGGVNTKIERNKIPELDYLSTICFELYESANNPPTSTPVAKSAAASDSSAGDNNSTQAVEDDAFNYSIRITISPGCHTFEPLDVQLDSRHCIGFAQRRSLTAHNDYKAVIETLRDKFHSVKLPKSFVAVNLSERFPQAFMKQTVEDRENDGRSSAENMGNDASTLVPSTTGEGESKITFAESRS